MTRPKEFKQAEETLAAIEWAEEYHERKIDQEVEWESDEDKQAYWKDRRRGTRWKFLFKNAPDLRCPRCKELKVKSREWVIFTVKGEKAKRRVALCRSCYWLAQSTTENDKPIRLPVNLFSVAEVRFSLDPKALRKAIHRMNISSSEFARRAGWSRGYQQKLENGAPNTIGEAAMNTIMNIIVGGLVFPDDAEEFYKELDRKGFFE